MMDCAYEGVIPEGECDVEEIEVAGGRHAAASIEVELGGFLQV